MSASVQHECAAFRCIPQSGASAALPVAGSSAVGVLTARFPPVKRPSRCLTVRTNKHSRLPAISREQIQIRANEIPRPVVPLYFHDASPIRRKVTGGSIVADMRAASLGLPSCKLAQTSRYGICRGSHNIRPTIFAGRTGTCSQFTLRP